MPSSCAGKLPGEGPCNHGAHDSTEEGVAQDAAGLDDKGPPPEQLQPNVADEQQAAEPPDEEEEEESWSMPPLVHCDCAIPCDL